MDVNLNSNFNSLKAEKHKTHALQQKVADQERLLLSSKQHLEAEIKRCENAQKKATGYMNEKLELEKSLTELKYNHSETKRELDNLQRENAQLKEAKCDLEIAVAESDAYEQILQENMESLENLCTALREQRDEQSSYFKQKEVSIKDAYQRQVQKIQEEKLLLNKQLTELKLENVNLKGEMQHLRDSQCDWTKERDLMKGEVENLTFRQSVLEKDLKLEKETVCMLSLKNTELSADLSKAKQAAQARSGTPFLSKETTRMIEELVEKFYAKKMESTTKFNDNRRSELSEKLAGSQAALTEEKRLRRELEIRLQSVDAEMQSAKLNADSLFDLSVKRTRNCLNRCNDLKSSYRRSKALTDVKALANSFDVSGVFDLTTDSNVSAKHVNTNPKLSSASAHDSTNVADSVLTSVSSGNDLFSFDAD